MIIAIACLCLLATAFAQSNETTSAAAAATSTSPATTVAETTTAAASATTAAVTATTAKAGPTIPCQQQVTTCEETSKKCAKSLAVHCGCVKDELACLKAAGNCTEATDAFEEAGFTCFSLGCNIDCSAEFGSTSCNLASAAVGCPNERVSCLRKSENGISACKCEAAYFKCVSGSRGCPGFPEAFESKMEECKKNKCSEEQCSIPLPDAASQLFIAPIAVLITTTLALNVE
jgi:hypothetical protein